MKTYNIHLLSGTTDFEKILKKHQNAFKSSSKGDLQITIKDEQSLFPIALEQEYPELYSDLKSHQIELFFIYPNDYDVQGGVGEWGEHRILLDNAYQVIFGANNAEWLWAKPLMFEPIDPNFL